MSTRTTFRPTTVINAGDMTGNLNSSPTILQSLTKFAYSASWSGTSPVGTLSVQLSNDYALGPNGTVANAGHWTTMTLSVNGSPSSTVSVSGNTGTAFIDVDVSAAYAARLIYTAGSGSGKITAVINAKVS